MSLHNEQIWIFVETFQLYFMHLGNFFIKHDHENKCPAAPTNLKMFPSVACLSFSTFLKYLFFIFSLLHYKGTKIIFQQECDEEKL